MFAVVVISGKQYKVTAGMVLSVEHIEGNVGDTLELSEVLLVGDGKTKIGTPNVAKAVVKAKIVAQEKGKKIDVRRFKSKVRERRHIGFRPLQTKLEILSIS